MYFAITKYCNPTNSTYFNPDIVPGCQKQEKPGMQTETLSKSIGKRAQGYCINGAVER